MECISKGRRRGPRYPLVIAGFAHLPHEGAERTVEAAQRPCQHGTLLPVAHTGILCVVPLPEPPPDTRLGEGDDSWSCSGNFDWTGATLWDCALVLSSALPYLLQSPAHSGRLLELGCGLGAVGLAAALLGHRCVSTDLAEELHLTMAAGAANRTAVASAGGSWEAAALDWRTPPSWVLEEHWDTVLASDIAYDDEQSTAADDAAEAAFPGILLQLTFDQLLLAERERSVPLTSSFFGRLAAVGLKAVRTDIVGGSPRGSSDTPLTPAVDIVVWRIY